MMHSNLNINWVPGITLEEMEKQCILSAFRFYRGNKTQTATALGISPRSLYDKLEKYDADQIEFDRRMQEETTQRVATLARMRGIVPAQKFEEPKAQSAAPSTLSGLHVEPLIGTEPQSVMPLLESKKVQEVLSGKASQGSKHRRS